MTSKGAPPSYKSEAWLVKMGWSRGEGLGKERAGRTEVVHVVKKDDNRGLGKQNYDLRDFSHWDNLFNKAAKKLDVHEGEEGVKIKKVKEEEKPAEVKPPSSYGGMFVKASSNTMHSKRDYNEKDLFSICGSRELRLYGQNGKHERLQKFDKGELNYVEPEQVLKRAKVASESDSTETERRRKRKEKEQEIREKKKKEESSEESSSDEEKSSSSSEVVKSKKRSKSKPKSKKSKISKKSKSESEESSSSSSSNSSSDSSSSSSSEEEKRSAKKKKRSRKESSGEESSDSGEERPRKKSKKSE